MRLPALVLALALAVSLAPLAPAAAAPQTVVVLVTGDENGHLLPNTEGDSPKGGAAETLGYWTAKEGHCPGRMGKDGVPACKDGKTLVLSTGDHFSGPSISSVFQGDSGRRGDGPHGLRGERHGQPRARLRPRAVRQAPRHAAASRTSRPTSARRAKKRQGLRPQAQALRHLRAGRGEDRRRRPLGLQRREDGDVGPVLRERGHPLRAGAPAGDPGGAQGRRGSGHRHRRRVPDGARADHRQAPGLEAGASSSAATATRPSSGRSARRPWSAPAAGGSDTSAPS